MIIPSYCGERWLGQALESIASQAADDIEVLLIDGGPTQAAVEIAHGYLKRIMLRVFDRSDLDSWLGKTNFAVGMARSQHICWMGVDDLWLPGRVMAVRRWIATAPDAPLHLAPSVIIDQHGQRLGVWRCPLRAGAVSSKLVVERFLVQNFVAACAPVFRKDAWLAVGGLDKNLWYSADWDLWLKLASLSEVHYHDDVTVAFRIHGESLTVVGSDDSAAFERQMELVLDRHIAHLTGDAGKIESAARVSIAMNTALAAAAVGDWSKLPRAARQLLCLGPSGVQRYLRDSRIIDRLMPRLRARLTRSL